MRGAQQMAYPQVVGSGADACTIHYSRNDKVLARRLAVGLLRRGPETWRLYRSTPKAPCQCSLAQRSLQDRYYSDACILSACAQTCLGVSTLSLLYFVPFLLSDPCMRMRSCRLGMQEASRTTWD